MTKKQVNAWMASRRINHREGTLPDWKIRMIERYLPDWIWDPYRDRKAPEEWVPVAEQVAAENGGKLPLVVWLRRNGYNALAHVTVDHPELFQHLPRAEKKVGRPVGSWVPIAEQVAREHGGTLPALVWLKNNGYTPMARAIVRHRDLFADIPQRRDAAPAVTLSESVAIAEGLAAEHDGVPSPKWLTTNGYNGVYNAFRRNPEAFAHIPKGRKWVKPLAEQVAIAEELATNNGGLLPTSWWLQHKGYRTIYQTRLRHPEAFAHIPVSHGRNKKVHTLHLVADQDVRPAPREKAA